ncbi:molybdopterin-guanine dinucleotide biosynthesis protein B [Neobacillus thermocopriae]|uniref:Molybdopterin-guanine dinucleotide biosynthesis protein B n=1 Tax=Neobacillus thermocopriae TaxID=1215031 RepID=A0A6B3TQI4_9BACI|nr:molybdopterin-guanine dinucleotide biosynthesis protein B [Neobacillus thermocopriae]
MALVNPVIIQIVGYQNSGKTTLILKLIKGLKELSIRTAVIKHHGHGGKPDLVEGKDSTKYLKAGANVSLVEGEGSLILQADKVPDGLKQQIKLLMYFQPELILVEGYKQENYPKILLLRNKKDIPLLHNLTNVIAILYWKDEINADIEKETMIPCYPINDETALQKMIQMFIRLIS